MNWRMANSTTHHKQVSHRFLSLDPTADHCLRHWGALFKDDHCQHKHEVALLISSWFTGASGASESTTLSSCGTNREALMPRCHHQYIRTVMMFPHKYFTLSCSIQDSQCMMEEETCVLSLLIGSWLKVNEKKSLDARHHEGVTLLTPFHVSGVFLHQAVHLWTFPPAHNPPCWTTPDSQR